MSAQAVFLTCLGIGLLVAGGYLLFKGRPFGLLFIRPGRELILVGATYGDWRRIRLGLTTMDVERSVVPMGRKCEAPGMVPTMLVMTRREAKS